MENFEIKNHKEFMNKLLMGNLFDDFLLKEAVIKTSYTFNIDGLENREFYGNDEAIIKEEAPFDYAMWSKAKAIVLALIKGKHTPVSMKITLYLKPNLMSNILGDDRTPVDYLIANFYFQNGQMNITTGIAYREFTLDREPEHRWDVYVSQLLDI